MSLIQTDYWYGRWMKGCGHLGAGAFGSGVKEPHSSCLHLPFGVLFYDLYLSSLLAIFFGTSVGSDSHVSEATYTSVWRIGRQVGEIQQ